MSQRLCIPTTCLELHGTKLFPANAHGSFWALVVQANPAMGIMVPKAKISHVCIFFMIYVWGILVIHKLLFFQGGETNHFQAIRGRFQGEVFGCAAKETS